MPHVFRAGLTVLAVAACTTIAEMPEERLGSAVLANASGLPIGTAQLIARGDAALLTVAVTGLEPGAHGFHLHTTGSCTAPDFKSAGGHLNPQGNQHGSLNPAGKHLGDLNNLEVGTSGTASASYGLTIPREDLLAWLFDADGTAIVIHAGPDDYQSDPAGNAGSRVACGVLQPT